MSNLQVIGPIGIREYTLGKKCEINEGHEHNYDHTTIVINGGIKVTYSYEQDGKTVEGESGEFYQGQAVCIKAGVKHAVKALSDNTKYMCVFSHRDFDGVVVEDYNGNLEAHE